MKCMQKNSQLVGVTEFPRNSPSRLCVDGQSTTLDPMADWLPVGLRLLKTKRPTEDPVLQWAVCRPDSHTGCRLAVSICRGHPLALLRGSRGTADAGQPYRQPLDRVKAGPSGSSGAQR